jgi:hypothetical protein
MDGCADVGGCLELPFALAELFSRGPKEATAILGTMALVGGLIVAFKPTPLPPPPKVPVTQRIKNAANTKINRWKIERAERQQQEQPASTAPVDTNKPRWRDRAKDWMRNRLNEDYQERNPGEKENSDNKH